MPKEVRSGTQEVYETGGDAEAVEGYYCLTLHDFLCLLSYKTKSTSSVIAPCSMDSPPLTCHSENDLQLCLMEAFHYLQLLSPL